MSRKTLIKLRNGRHRVATPAEAIALDRIRAKDDQIHRLQREIAPLKKEFDINSRLLEALALEFGDKARPHIENFIRIAESLRGGLRLASLQKIDEVHEVKYRRHTAFIPEIMFCYQEEIRPGSARG